jgi:hypothetical protein
MTFKYKSESLNKLEIHNSEIRLGVVGAGVRLKLDNLNIKIIIIFFCFNHQFNLVWVSSDIK